MLAAGLDPDVALAAVGVDVGDIDVDFDMDVDSTTKKRRPSCSPEGKNWTSPESDDDDDDCEEQDTSLKSKEEWMSHSYRISLGTATLNSRGFESCSRRFIHNKKLSKQIQIDSKHSLSRATIIQSPLQFF